MPNSSGAMPRPAAAPTYWRRVSSSTAAARGRPQLLFGQGDPMEKIQYDYPPLHSVPRRVHVGVVGSGDLEGLLEPSPDALAHVVVNASVDGFEATWKNVLDRFFARFRGA